MRALAIIAVALAACGSEPQLDAAHLPADLLGLIPGVATEADVLAALPGATVIRDHRLGGEKIVEVNDRPGVNVRSADERTNVWLVKVDGTLRLVWFTAPHVAECAAIAATFGARAKAGTCHYSNRVPGSKEHQQCAAGAGGHAIEINCHDRGPLDVFFEYEGGVNGRGYKIAPRTP